jgi:hypothetical protein
LGAQKFVTAYNTKKAPATLNLSKCVIATDKYGKRIHLLALMNQMI